MVCELHSVIAVDYNIGFTMPKYLR